MTQVERLIRNLCEERRLGILEGERTAIKQVPESTPWKDLPKQVQGAIREYRFIEKRQKEMQDRVKRAGYQSYNMYVGKALQLTGRDGKIVTLRAKYDTRRTAIQKLRTDATIASLGKSAVEAQGILTQLQKDLAAV